MQKVGNVPQSVAEGKREGRKTPTQISASKRKHSTQVEEKPNAHGSGVLGDT